MIQLFVVSLSTVSDELEDFQLNKGDDAEWKDESQSDLGEDFFP
jgi:hypothetical protein